MKKVMVVFSLAVVIVMLSVFLTTGSAEVSKPEIKKNCSGYVVIEAGKGINCNGDTIKLTKKHGYFEIASK